MKLRRAGFKKTKRLYVLSTEGAETEPIYFQEFRPHRDSGFRLKILGNPNHKSNPVDVVRRLIEYERRERPGPNTEYWAIIDRDAWLESDLHAAYEEARGRKDFHVAMSNRCFELWLWLHLRPYRSFSDRYDCQRQMEREWPKYSKCDYPAAELLPFVKIACERAEELTANSPSWPRTQGTDVSKLVRKFLL